MLSLRPATADDTPHLSAIAFASKASHGYDDDFMAACRDELTVTPATIATDWVYVAIGVAKTGNDTAKTDNGAPAPLGFIQLSEKPDTETETAAGPTGYIEALFIAPDAKGQGVGRALWAAMLQEARARRYRRLDLARDPFFIWPWAWRSGGPHHQGLFPAGRCR